MNHFAFVCRRHMSSRMSAPPAGRAGMFNAVKRSPASLHVNTSLHVTDRYVPPARWFPPWREVRKRWFNMTQSYMWTNRIILALRDQTRVANGRAPKRVLEPSRQIALSMQLLLPRAFVFGAPFSRRRFARNDATDIYRRLNAAYATGDTVTIRALAADNYARTLLSQIKHRTVPPGLSLAFDAQVRSAHVVNVRCAIVPRPYFEFAQVLVRIRSTQSVSVLRPNNADPAAEPHLVSRQTRELVEVIAFERNLIDKNGRWLVLDRISTEVLNESATVPEQQQQQQKQ
jgi:hypothetical protein